MKASTDLHVGLLLAFLFTVFGIEVPLEVKQPPTITAQSSRSLVAMLFDDHFTFTCNAQGNPKPLFQWTRDGQEFNPAKESGIKMYNNSGSFVLPSSKHLSSYRGIYRCYASNEFGTAISEEINFTVPSLPKFPNERLKPLVVNEGDSVVLQCNPPNGIPPRQLYWMTMGLQHITQNDRVSMGRNGSLYFSNVVKNDSRNDYCCFASFPTIRTIVQKTAMAIKVIPFNESGMADYKSLDKNPKLMVPTGSESIVDQLVGQELQLECIAEGYPTPKIEWSKSGTKLPQRTNIRNYGKLLTISGLSEEDSGQYTCRANNSAGETVHNFHVNVEEPPRWVEEPIKTQVVTNGSDLYIKCHVAGKPQPTITWMKNGKPLREFSLPHVRVLNDSIILHKVRPNDTAVYQCEASNRHGTLLSNANIMVMSMPPWMLTRNDLRYNIVLGQSVIMNCEVFSSPPAAINWKKEDPEGSVQGERFTLHKNGSLQIHTTKSEDTGRYTCFVKNSEGVAKISAELYIKEPTKIVNPPQDSEIIRGTTAKLQCQAKYDLSLRDEFEIIWKKEGEETGFNNTNDSGYHIVKIVKGMLHIINVSRTDEGMYTCIARTTLDQDTASANVTVLDVPDPPVNVSLSDQRDRSVKLHWLPTKYYHSPITEYIIEYEENHWDPGKWKTLLRVSSYQHHAPLPLYGHINYQFRVSAVNAIGKGPPSEPSERYKTPPAAPDRNPENIKVVGHSPHQMDITWEPLLPIEHNGPGLEYKLSYRKLGLEQSWTEHRIKRHTFVVKDTPTYIPYEIKIHTHNDHGWAVEPNVVIGYSGEDLPVAAPGDVHVEVLNSTLLRLSWSPVQNPQLRGHLEGYKVHWWRTQNLLTSLGVPAEKQYLTVPGNQSHTMVPRLKPFSEYRLTVNVFNRKGNGPSSSPITFTTPQGVPGRLPTLQATNLQDDSISLVWAPPPEANGILTGYWLQYHKFNETLDVGETYTVNISDPDKTHWTLHDLESGSQYKFYLSACTDVGCGPAFTVEGITATAARMEGAHGSTSSTTLVIGILCAVALCTLVVLIACFVTKNKAGIYSVKDKEKIRTDLESRCKNQETACQYSYSDKKPLKSQQPSPGEDIKDDSSSMYSSDDYNDEDSEFNEDGSFIGEYVTNRRKVSMEIGHYGGTN